MGHVYNAPPALLLAVPSGAGGGDAPGALRRTIAMREKPDVRDYRAWMQDTQTEINRNKIAGRRKKEINTIAEALRRCTEPTRLAVTVSLFPLLPNVPLDLTRARDWLCSNWPGKALSQAAAAPCYFEEGDLRSGEGRIPYMVSAHIIERSS
jgi:hypothetical protein